MGLLDALDSLGYGADVLDRLVSSSQVVTEGSLLQMGTDLLRSGVFTAYDNANLLLEVDGEPMLVMTYHDGKDHYDFGVNLDGVIIYFDEVPVHG